LKDERSGLAKGKKVGRKNELRNKANKVGRELKEIRRRKEFKSKVD
jgi:hypothetical protein